MAQQIAEEEKYREPSFERSSSGLFMDKFIYTDRATILDKFAGFHKLPLEEQTAYVKHLREIHETVKDKEFESLVRTMLDLDGHQRAAAHNHDVLLLLLDALPAVFQLLNFDRASAVFLGREEARRSLQKRASRACPAKAAVTDLILEFIEFCLLYQRAEVRAAAVDSLGLVADFLMPFDYDEKLLSLITGLLQKNTRALSLIGLDLLAKFAHLFSANFLETLVFPELARLLDGEESFLRQRAFAAFFSVALNVSGCFYERSVKARVFASLQDKDLAVRLIALESLDGVVARSAVDDILNRLLKALVEILKGKNKPLKAAAFRRVGAVLEAFLGRFSKSVVGQKMEGLNPLFKFYFNQVQLTEELAPEARGDIFASNLRHVEAIVKKFGDDIWPYLSYLLTRLDEAGGAAAVIRFKLALAPRLSAIARHLSAELVGGQLLPLVSARFLLIGGQTSQPVKIAALPELLPLLKRLDRRARKSFGDYYIGVQADSKSWRFRYTVALQVGELFELFDCEELVTFIVPLFFGLCRDDCALVRRQAAGQFHHLAALLARRHPELYYLAADHLKSFAAYPRFTLRLAFLDMMESLCRFQPALVEPELEELLLAAARDRVLNVRAKAALVAQALEEQACLDPLRAALLAVLRQDGSAEVARLLSAQL